MSQPYLILIWIKFSSIWESSKGWISTKRSRTRMIEINSTLFALNFNLVMKTEKFHPLYRSQCQITPNKISPGPKLHLGNPSFHLGPISTRTHASIPPYFCIQRTLNHGFRLRNFEILRAVGLNPHISSLSLMYAEDSNSTFWQLNWRHDSLGMTSSINIGQDKTLNKSSSFNRTFMVFIFQFCIFIIRRGRNKTFLCSACNSSDSNQLASNSF